MSLEYLNWFKTSESERPIVIDKDNQNKFTSKLCLVKLTNTEEELTNLCHNKEFESDEDKLGSNTRILCYDSECDAWLDENYEKFGDFSSVYAWYPISYINDYLDYITGYLDGKV